MSDRAPTFGETQILELLNASNGDVGIVAKEVGVSPRYIQRVKSMHWVQPDPALTAIVASPPSVSTQENDVVPYIGPDVERVITLRTKTLDLLTSAVETGDIKVREATKLLEILLMYENSLRATMAPNLSIYQDNRKQTVHVTQLVDALSNRLSADQLRQAAGIVAPMEIIIEGEKSDV